MGVTTINTKRHNQFHEQSHVRGESLQVVIELSPLEPMVRQKLQYVLVVVLEKFNRVTSVFGTRILYNSVLGYFFSQRLDSSVN